MTFQQIRSEVAAWREDIRERWNERAAIIEHDGKLSRAKAEELAYWECRPHADLPIPERQKTFFEVLRGQLGGKHG